MPGPKKLDPQLVERCAAIGCTDREIALILDCSEALLRRRYRKALDAGRARLQKSLRRKQLEMARRGSVPMLIWLGKQYLGQTDRQEIAQTERVEVVEEIAFPKEGDSHGGQDGQPEATSG